MHGTVDGNEVRERATVGIESRGEGINKSVCCLRLTQRKDVQDREMTSRPAQAEMAARDFQNVISSVNSGFASRMARLRACWTSDCGGS